MGATSGGGGNGGRSGGSQGGGPSEEAKLQARVDNMNNLVGKLNTEVNAKKQGVKNMERELSRFSERDRSTKEVRRTLEKSIQKGNREIAIKTRRLLNIYDRMNKIIDENS